VTVSSSGTITAPDKPGIGFEVNLERVEELTVRKEAIS
jgi:L-alanine-DL-glutamate epimerase-like enolase superfamily enzyme